MLGLRLGVEGRGEDGPGPFLSAGHREDRRRGRGGDIGRRRGRARASRPSRGHAQGRSHQDRRALLVVRRRLGLTEHASGDALSGLDPQRRADVGVLGRSSLEVDDALLDAASGQGERSGGGEADEDLSAAGHRSPSWVSDGAFRGRTRATPASTATRPAKARKSDW